MPISIGPFSDLDSVAKPYHEHIGNSCEESAFDNSRQLLDCPFEPGRIGDRVEPAVDYVVPIVGHEGRLRFTAQFGLATQRAQVL